MTCARQDLDRLVAQHCVRCSRSSFACGRRPPVGHSVMPRQGNSLHLDQRSRRSRSDVRRMFSAGSRQLRRPHGRGPLAARNGRDQNPCSACRAMLACRASAHGSPARPLTTCTSVWRTLRQTRAAPPARDPAGPARVWPCKEPACRRNPTAAAAPPTRAAVHGEPRVPRSGQRGRYGMRETGG